MIVIVFIIGNFYEVFKGSVDKLIVCLYKIRMVLIDIIIYPVIFIEKPRNRKKFFLPIEVCDYLIYFFDLRYFFFLIFLKKHL